MALDLKKWRNRETLTAKAYNYERDKIIAEITRLKNALEDAGYQKVITSDDTPSVEMFEGDFWFDIEDDG